jgi:hypothetical protein
MSKSVLSTTEKLNRIQARLRKGDVQSIAFQTGYDASHVSRVLRGISKNPSNRIVNATYTKVASRKAIA